MNNKDKSSEHFKANEESEDGQLMSGWSGERCLKQSKNRFQQWVNQQEIEGISIYDVDV